MAARRWPVERRFVHRVPWLVVGLLGALLSADLVGGPDGEGAATEVAFRQERLFRQVDLGTDPGRVVPEHCAGLGERGEPVAHRVTLAVIALTVRFPLGRGRWLEHAATNAAPARTDRPAGHRPRSRHGGRPGRTLR